MDETRNRYVVDTHALFWYLVHSPRLSEAGYQVFQKAFAGETTLILSPIVLLELYGLVRKVDAPSQFYRRVSAVRTTSFSR